MGERFCTVCGHQLEVGDRFCTACGSAVTTSVPAPEQAHPAPPRHADAQPPTPRPRGAARWLIYLVPAALVVAAASFGLGMLTDHHDDHPETAPVATSGTPSAGLGASSSPGTPTTSASAAPDPAALKQANALASLLTDSAADKRAIAAAAAELSSCHHLTKAVQAFTQAAQSRSALVTRASELQIGLLPGGGQVVASLTKALQDSAAADQAYVAWGRTLHRGTGKHHRCKGDDSLRTRATDLSTASHAPKQATAKAWNLIASQFGLQQIAWSSL